MSESIDKIAICGKCKSESIIRHKGAYFCGNCDLQYSDEFLEWKEEDDGWDPILEEYR